MSWMRKVFFVVLVVTVASCGIKRPLKSPSQIALEEQKKAQKEAKKKEKDAGTAPAQPEEKE